MDQLRVHVDVIRQTIKDALAPILPGRDWGWQPVPRRRVGAWLRSVNYFSEIGQQERPDALFIAVLLIGKGEAGLSRRPSRGADATAIQ